MTTVLRRQRSVRRPIGGIAAIVGLVVVILVLVVGVLAWRAGGPRPIAAVVVPLTVPSAATTPDTGRPQ